MRLTPAQKQDLCDRADAGEPVLALLSEYDLHHAHFYHVYRAVRGVAWPEAHPRTGKAKRPGTHLRASTSPYVKYQRCMRANTWTGTPEQLREYLGAMP